MDHLINSNRLYQNSDYQSYLEKISYCESNREFCRHNLAHFLDVARIATIKCYESKLGLSRDLIYTTALLHDIGRFEQYLNKTPHEAASHELALALLEILDFNETEKQQILSAIKNHRNPQTSGFDRIFYESDKLSRNCLICPVEKKCDWPADKKNLTLLY
ncbi:HD domain-containing protein [Eubacteriaceae bacterium ES3]|nr:HD domain-containing protein [Eubacteriaceae bacterium ES3]